MSLSNSRLAYIDCFELLDKAVADPRGIRAQVATHAAATHLRMRIHQARSIDRTENAKTYPYDHPLHGRSPYDVFVCRIEGTGPCWLYLDREKVQIEAVESIPEDYQIPQVEAPPRLLMIEGPKAEVPPQPMLRRR